MAGVSAGAVTGDGSCGGDVGVGREAGGRRAVLHHAAGGLLPN